MNHVFKLLVRVVRGIPPSPLNRAHALSAAFSRVRKGAAFASFVFLLGLAACQPTSTAPSETTPYNGGPRGNAILTGPQAVEVLIDICGASLPDFEDAEARMSDTGFSLRAPSGTHFHTEFDASMRVSEESGGLNGCSLVFVSTDDMAAVLTAVDQTIGPLTQTSLGIATLYDNDAVILVQPPRVSGGRTYYTLRMLSER